ncbi:S1 RNA-binding domain-containing protein [Streptomyces heilongjiangensis]|uniref:S1 RNA-binding domain-containing protein n=1 Tax=Streptomyces heilongjiangensis TaxID=945052 RepID=A0ABW1BJ19_9ACTN|nr:S1 RNA-binding domain-containing protein [Streptomyces heilongjiangensis]MDC2952517.1 S1 RNA-binding domain-containing protein [Streptomyces heilongjiangensis]
MEDGERDAVRAFLAGVRVGEVRGGVVAEVTSRGAAVVLDGFPSRPVGAVGTLDLTWGPRAEAGLVVGQRVTGEVIGVDAGRGEVRMSTAATRHPLLWRFLRGLRAGRVLNGTVASIESFGVFVALDEGPAHPIHPGVGFVTFPELSWRYFEDPSDVVRVGERVSGVFLQFDTTNGEARLSLRALLPDPFQEFADAAVVGRVLRGRVTKAVPFGVFVEVADGVEGLVRSTGTAVEGPAAPGDAVAPGEGLTVAVVGVDRARRTLLLSRVRAPGEPGEAPGSGRPPARR